MRKVLVVGPAKQGVEDVSDDLSSALETDLYEAIADLTDAKTGWRIDSAQTSITYAPGIVIGVLTALVTSYTKEAC